MKLSEIKAVSPEDFVVFEDAVFFGLAVAIVKVIKHGNG